MKNILMTILSAMISLQCFGHSVVVNKKNKIPRFDAEFVRNIYLGEFIRWEGNYPVHLVDYNSSFPLRQEFSEEIIGMSVTRVYKQWVKLSLSGNATPPKILRSEKEMIEYVAQDPFAIGYVSDTTKETSKNEDVRIIKIE